MYKYKYMILAIALIACQKTLEKKGLETNNTKKSSDSNALVEKNLTATDSEQSAKNKAETQVKSKENPEVSFKNFSTSYTFSGLI